MSQALEITEGVKNVNPFPVDRIKMNVQGDIYTNVNQVLQEQILAIRSVGQSYFVDNGNGGIDEYWFRDGTNNNQLILKRHSAEEVPYDNTNSGLLASNAQDAIDESNQKIEDASVWKKSLSGALRSADLSEDGFENINHVTTGITVGTNNVLGETGQPYSAYASMILGSEITNKTSGFGLVSGAKHILDTIGGSYNTVVGFFNKIVTTNASNTNFLAGKFNSVYGNASEGNTSFGGVDLVNDPNSPSKFLEIDGFGNFNTSWVSETGASSTKGFLKGLFNFMSGHNNEIEANTQTCAILGGSNNSIPSGLSNVAILGGKGLTASKSEYSYTGGLNIKTVPSGTPIASLSIDSNGYVIVSDKKTGIINTTWAELLLSKQAGDIALGDTYKITDQGNEEILISGKSPNGSYWFVRTDNAGAQTVFEVA